MSTILFTDSSHPRFLASENMLFTASLVFDVTIPYLGGMATGLLDEYH
jgi:hypothetical protein